MVGKTELFIFSVYFVVDLKVCGTGKKTWWGRTSGSFSSLVCCQEVDTMRQGSSTRPEDEVGCVTVMCRSSHQVVMASWPR